MAPRAGGGGGGAINEVKMSGKDKWYRPYTKSRGASGKSFNDHLPKEIKSALGKSLDEQFTETNQALTRNEQERQAKQKQKEQIEQRSEPKGKIRQALDSLRNLIEHKDDEIQEAEDRPGPLDTEKIQRLKYEQRSLEAENQAKRKQFLQAQKDAEQADKLQEEINKLTQRNRALDSTLNELKAKKKPPSNRSTN